MRKVFKVQMHRKAMKNEIERFRFNPEKRYYEDLKIRKKSY